MSRTAVLGILVVGGALTAACALRGAPPPAAPATVSAPAPPALASPVLALGDDRLRVQPRTLAFADDGRTLVAGDEHSTQYFDVQTGQVVRTGPPAPSEQPTSRSTVVAVDPYRDFTLPLEQTTSKRGTEMRRAQVLSAAWSPSGGRIAIELMNGGVLLFERTDLVHPRRFDWPGTGGAWSSEHPGRLAFVGEDRLAQASDGAGVRLFDLGSGALLRTFSSRVHDHVTASGDGRVLATWGMQTGVQLWSVDTGAERVPHAGHRGIVSAIGFAPDGARLVTGSMDGTVRLWNAETGAEERVLEVASPIAGLALDGKGRVALNAYQRVEVWTLADGARAFASRPLGGSNTNEEIAFTPDGGAVEYHAHYGNPIYRWELARDATVELPEDATLARMRALATNYYEARVADGKRTLLAERDGVVLRALPDGGELQRLPTVTSSALAIAPGGGAFAVGERDGRIIWMNGQRRRELHPWRDTPVTALAFAPDGRALAAGALDGRALMWHPLDTAPAATVPAASDAHAPVDDKANDAAVTITSPCVLHAGDSHRQRRESRSAKGQSGRVVESGDCSFSAECVQEQGKSAPGDGNVELACVDRKCTCRKALLSAPERSTTVDFEADAACLTADQAQRLLVERCLKGLKIAGQAKPAADGPAPICLPGGWCAQSPLPQSRHLPKHISALWGADVADVWAVGAFPPSLAHWDGHAWRDVTTPETPNLFDVWGTAPDDVWVAGEDLLHWDGHAWTRSPSVLWFAAKRLWGTARDDVWAAGDDGVLHWDGCRWSIARNQRRGMYQAGWSRSRDDVWLLRGREDQSAPPVEHWDGATWSSESQTFNGALMDVWGSGDGALWAVSAYGSLYRRESPKGWVEVRSPALGEPLRRLFGLGDDALWALGKSVLLRWDGTSWTSRALPVENPRSWWVSPRGQVWLPLGPGRGLVAGKAELAVARPPSTAAAASPTRACAELPPDEVASGLAAAAPDAATVTEKQPPSTTVATAIAQRWLTAVRDASFTELATLASLPFTVEGFNLPSGPTRERCAGARRAAGLQGVRPLHGAGVASTARDAGGLRELLGCFLRDSLFHETIPRGPTGRETKRLRVVPVARVAAALARFRARLRALPPEAVIVEATLTNNDGVTNRAAIVVTGDETSAHVSAVYIDELFEE